MVSEDLEKSTPGAVSTVYFADLRATYKKNLMAKIRTLLDACGLADRLKAKDLTAVKLHFGEIGNSAFIRPVYIREIIGSIQDAGGIPFLTDSNTLYAGTRGTAPTHITTAIQNGFAYPVVGAPTIIADGLRGKGERAVEIGQQHFRQVYVGSEIAHSDFLVSAAHFKCHELTGIAGTLKNLGMGCASRRGKLAQHSSVNPKVKRKRCVGCGDCLEHCPENAIVLKDGKASIRSEQCIGCGECILICPGGAVQVQWDKSVPLFMERMVEYVMGVLKGKSGNALFLNFIVDVSPTCDCEPYNDMPIVADVGIAASTDPVAIDQASADLVNRQEALAGSCLKTCRAAGEDKFRGLYPQVDWEHQLAYAEGLGIGSRRYRLSVL